MARVLVLPSTTCDLLASTTADIEHRPPHDQMINRDGRRDESAIIRDCSDLNEAHAALRPSNIPNIQCNNKPGRTREEERGGRGLSAGGRGMMNDSSFYQ